MLVPSRFNGPPDSANGGYTCGLVACELAGSGAEVTLRAPPPLETEMAVETRDGTVRVRAGDTVVAEGREAAVDVGDPPPPVGPAEAAAAVAAGTDRWTARHPFPTCVVCGPDRSEGDGMRIFPGPLDGGRRFAATWTPDASVADSDGVVRPECVWAALDCPTSAPVANFGEGPPVVLGRLAATLEAPVRTGETYALLSWELGRDGRKREAACVLLDAQARMLARSRALWIELRER